MKMLFESLDPMGTFIFIGIAAVYLLAYFVCVKVFSMFSAGVFIVIGFLFINFIGLGVSVFLIYKQATSGKLPMPKLGGLLNKKKELSLGEYFGELKYPMTLISTMCVVGAGYSYA